MDQVIVTLKPWGRWSWHWTATNTKTGMYYYGVKWSEKAARKAADIAAKKMAATYEYEWKPQ